MIPQTCIKKNINLQNIKRAAEINLRLKIYGYTQKQIADELGISLVWVCKVINGHGYNAKIEKWIEEHLGL